MCHNQCKGFTQLWIISVSNYLKVYKCIHVLCKVVNIVIHTNMVYDLSRVNDTAVSENSARHQSLLLLLLLLLLFT